MFEVEGVDSSKLDQLVRRWGFEQKAADSGFLQTLDQSQLLRSLLARPGWLAWALDGIGAEKGALSANAIIEGLVKRLDSETRDPWPRVAWRQHESKGLSGPLDEVPVPRRRSGLIQHLQDDLIRFVHPALQVYFAAEYAANKKLDLIEKADEEWWAPVLTLSVAGRDAESAADIIESLAQLGQTDLASAAFRELSFENIPLLRRLLVELMDGIGHGDSKQDRRNAVGLSGLLHSDTVKRSGIVSPLLAALSSDYSEVSVSAAAALARLGDPSAIAPLLTSLGDPDDAIRHASSKALATFGDRTVQPLVRQLNVPDERLRLAAMEALALQGHRAVKALVPLLDASSATLRKEVSEALAGIGPDAVPDLVSVIEATPPRGESSETAVAGAADALILIGRQAVGPLLPILADADPDTTNRILDIIKSIGSDAVDALGEVVSSDNHPDANAAVAALGIFEDLGPQAGPHLVKALADPRFELRWDARRSLRRIGASGMDAMLGALNSSDKELSWEVTQILMSLPEPPVEPLIAKLNQMLASEESAERRRAVPALGSLSGPEALASLTQVVNDDDIIVRRSAIVQLGSLGDPSAAKVLEDRWPKEEDDETQQALLTSLVDLAPEMASSVLIDALRQPDKTLRAQAVDLLNDVGEPAAIPLVVALNAEPSAFDLEDGLRVLDGIGRDARAGSRTPANLARAYHRMLVESLDVEELLYLASTIEWWTPGQELHRTFSSLKSFLAIQSLGGIGAAESELEWTESMADEDWLRPTARRALRQLRMISQAVQYYNRGATRRSKEKGLLAAADRINSLQQMMGDMGEPHVRIFHDVGAVWSELINQAIRELQGEAALELEMRTEHVRIREAETAAVLVFDLVNSGEGLASNVQLSLTVDESELSLSSPSIHYLPPLGQGDRISSEYTVRRSGAGVTAIELEVRYDDPQSEGQTRKFNREVRFFVEEAEYKEIGTSPYIAGPPVKSREMFYGRQPTFNWIQENLSGTFQDNVLVLYGERRTGKTSVLYQMQHHLPEVYAFVLIDLQTIAYGLDSTSNLLYAMARKMINGLRRQGFELERPKRTDYEEHPIEEFETLGETIGDMAIDMDRRAVLIADEFDLLIEAIDRGDVSPFVFDCIRGLMQHQDGLSFIFAGAHALTAMIKNPRSILFNTALRRKVSFLERDEAERLIREPVADVLWYDDLAVEKILRVTAGQPYFIQYICHEIVNLARRDAKNFVTLRDVDRALQTTVQETTGIIRHSYMSLSQEEQLALAALARITDDGRPFVSLEDIVETLRQDGITMNVHELREIMHQMAERDFIAERGGGDSAGRQYGFAMDLVRVWLEQNDEYTRLLEELRG